jgi:hypothetical protein
MYPSLHFFLKPIQPHFFYKEHILISKRYQIHPALATMQCPSGNTDAHSKKEEEIQKNKVLLQ